MSQHDVREDKPRSISVSTVNGYRKLLLVEFDREVTPKEAVDFCASLSSSTDIERDAARYRWLAKYQWDLIILPRFVGHPEKDGHEYASTKAEFEAALDEAIDAPYPSPRTPCR